MMNGPLLRALLEERFQLRVHNEQREVPVYELTRAEGAPELQPASESARKAAESGARTLHRYPEPGLMTMAQFCRQYGMFLDAELVDRTGLVGVFDLHLSMMIDAPVDNPISQGYIAAEMIELLESRGFHVTLSRAIKDVPVIDHIQWLSRG
jgi:uncharacterized protein (TIGR03435 family)